MTRRLKLLFKNIRIIFRIVWYIGLLVAGTIYIYIYHNQIGSISNLNATSLIFIVWLILLIYPLFSEMQIGNITLKKEIKKLEEHQSEIKESVRELKMQIIESKITNSNNNTNTLVLNQGSVLESETGLKKIVSELKRNTNQTNENLLKEPDISEQTIYFFKIRSDFERLITAICEDIGCEKQKHLNQTVLLLIQLEIIPKSIDHAILQIIEILDRGVHGEIVDSVYETFVKNAYPEIAVRLQKIHSELKEKNVKLEYCICPKCHYQGPSKYENSCPNCGYTWSE